MKKRFLAILLTVVMVLALAVPALAATETRINAATYVDPEYAFDNSQKLVKVNHNGLFGYVDYYGNIKVHEKYSDIAKFSEGLVAAEKDGVVCYVDPNGVEVFTVGVVEYAGNFHSGLARIVKNGNTYFVDKTGKSVIILGQTTASDFDSNGVAQIYANGKIGLINTRGDNLCHVVYDVMRPFSEGLAYVEWNGNKGYINTNGQLVIAGLNSAYVFSDFSDGMAKVTDPATLQVGYIDRTGWLAVYCIYEDGDDFHNGVARIKYNGLWGYIDKSNKYTVQPEYNYLGDWTEGNLVVAGKLGTETANNGGTSIVIDGNNHLVATTNPGTTVTRMYYGHVNVLNGAVVTPLVYHAAHPFSDGLAQVQLWSAVSFVNTNGVRVIDLGSYYDFAGDFSDGMCYVAKNSKYGYINKAGALQIPMIFDVEYDAEGTGWYYDFEAGYAPCRIASFSQPSRWGIINKNCQWVVNPKYTSMDQLDATGLVWLAEDGGVNSHIIVLEAAAAAAPAPAAPAATSTTYTVKAGDTLGTISNAFYGTPSLYQKIYNANTDKLSDPNTIVPGQVLVIPAK